MSADADPAAPASGAGADAHARFPRLSARTRRFTLGLPRALRISPDGARVTFLRSHSGEDPATALWVLDVPTGQERCVADPRALGGAEAVPAAERARRERSRETASGVVSYATDEAVTVASFALDGRLHVAALDDPAAGGARAHELPGSVVDPRPDPTGAAVAFVADGEVWVTGLWPGAQRPRRVAGEAAPAATVQWGLAEFIAAEEMGRSRGFWWAPDGARLAVARVDTAAVPRWHLADPADPAQPPTTLAYPAAGTANAEVGLFVVGADGAGEPVEVGWDRAALPYLTAVWWPADGPLSCVVQSRDQRLLQVLVVDPDTGASTPAHEQRDAHWVELIPGAPRWLPDGRLLHPLDGRRARQLAVDGAAITPPELEVRRIVAADAAACVVVASTEAPAPQLWRVPLDGGAPEALTAADALGDGAAAGPGLRATVTVEHRLDRDAPTVLARTPFGQAPVGSAAAPLPLTPQVQLLRLGARELHAALVLPAGHAGDGPPLPVLLSPYGGPHAQRVLRSRRAFALAQWFADAGFAVLIVDGRGTPGRGPAWEKAVAGDLLSAPLDDQVEALSAAAEQLPVLDTSRVAIRGWSFGGFLAAAAVLRRPETFHAAVAGAPVTDWRLYDTHYSERYLGHPAAQPEAYAQSSLLDDAPALRRPLLLVHGLADDNVVAAHTLRLSQRLLAAGRPHQLLPLPGVTHLASEEAVTEGLLRLELDFLRAALAAGPGDPRAAATANCHTSGAAWGR